MEEKDTIRKSENLEHKTGLGERLKGSPEEIREKARNAVGKAVAGTAGAIEGYVEQAEPKIAGEAARAVKESVKAVTEEGKSQIESLRSEGILPEAKPKVPETSETEGPGMKEKLGEKTQHMRERAMERGTELRERAREGLSHMREQAADKTPDEVREMTREAVGRPVAAATGALEGVVEQQDPDVLREATAKVGETVKETAKGLKGEGHEKRALDESSSGGI